jgi:hypothetical protein
MGRKPRYELDNIIVGILLEYPKSLRYKDLVKEVNRRCKGEKPTSLRFGEIFPIGYKPEEQEKKPLIQHLIGA